MQDFMLIFEGGDSDWATKLPQDEIMEVMKEWGAWFEELENSGNLRNPGAALENAGTALKVQNGEIVTDSLSSELKELIGGYSVIQAESLEHAAELAKGSPHLRTDPDGRVQIRPIMATPSD